MDANIRHALADLYRQVSSLVEITADSRATVLALRRAICDVPALAEAFHKHNNSADVVDIRLQACTVQVSLNEAIQELETLKT